MGVAPVDIDHIDQVAGAVVAEANDTPERVGHRRDMGAGAVVAELQRTSGRIRDGGKATLTVVGQAGDVAVQILLGREPPAAIEREGIPVSANKCP